MLAFDQSNEQPRGNTMFAKATIGPAGILATASRALSAAIGQQHPSGPSSMYTGSLSIGDAHVRASSRIRRGDIVESSAWRTGKSVTGELYDACHNMGAKANVATADVVS
jgi:hypothetical protein